MNGIVSLMKFGRGGPESEPSAHGESGWGAAESPMPNSKAGEQAATLPFPRKEEVTQTEAALFPQSTSQPGEKANEQPGG